MEKRLLLIATIALLSATAFSQTAELMFDKVIREFSVVGENLVFSTSVPDLANSDSTLFFDGERVTSIAGGGSNFTAFQGKIFFKQFIPSVGSEIFSSDGTSSGTSVTTDLNSMGAECEYILGVVSGKLFFYGWGEDTGLELWVSDGTSQGTHIVKNINPGSSDGIFDYRTHFAIMDDRLFFCADDGNSGLELWVSDGTEAGTFMVKDINEGSGWGYPQYLTVIGNRIFFTASSQAEGSELWVTDGTTDGTRLVVDATPGPESSDVNNIVTFNNKIYFTVRTYNPFGISGAQSIYDLWETDGTSTGSQVFLNGVNGMHVFNNHLFFGKAIANTQPFSKFELYKTDGTLQGTTLVKAIEGGGSFQAPSYYLEVNGKLFFLCRYDVNGANYQDNDLWVTDGTTDGTQLIIYDAEDNPVNVNLGPGLPRSFRGNLVFADNYENWLYKVEGGGVINATRELPTQSTFSISPNPTQGLLNIIAETPVQLVNIYNLTGTLVQTECNSSFSIANLNPGVYLLQIHVQEGILTSRLVKN